MPEAIMFRRSGRQAPMETEILLWGEADGASGLRMFCDPSTAEAIAAETNVALTAEADLPDWDAAVVKSDGDPPVASRELVVRLGPGADHGLWREPEHGEATFVARLQGSRERVKALLEVLPLRAVEADA